jgi:hypothetical protein
MPQTGQAETGTPDMTAIHRVVMIGICRLAPSCCGRPLVKGVVRFAFYQILPQHPPRTLVSCAFSSLVSLSAAAACGDHAVGCCCLSWGDTREQARIVASARIFCILVCGLDQELATKWPYNWFTGLIFTCVLHHFSSLAGLKGPWGHGAKN